MKFNQVILRHPLKELRRSKRLARSRTRLKTFDSEKWREWEQEETYLKWKAKIECPAD